MATVTSTVSTIPPPLLFGRIRRHLFLPDVSASMDQSDYPPTRFDAAMTACHGYLERLVPHQPDDEVMIISYSEEAHILCPWIPIAHWRENQGLAAAWAQEARQHGLRRTNISSSLEKALAAARAYPGAIHVVLLTDGHHNTGPDPYVFANELKLWATISTVGIGSSPLDVDETLLRQIASPDADGQPRYRWIGDRGRLIAHFERLARGICRS